MARKVAHVNRGLQTFCVLFRSNLRLHGPKRSTPVRRMEAKMVSISLWQVSHQGMVRWLAKLSACGTISDYAFRKVSSARYPKLARLSERVLSGLP